MEKRNTISRDAQPMARGPILARESWPANVVNKIKLI